MAISPVIAQYNGHLEIANLSANIHEVSFSCKLHFLIISFYNFISVPFLCEMYTNYLNSGTDNNTSIIIY